MNAMKLEIDSPVQISDHLTHRFGNVIEFSPDGKRARVEWTWCRMLKGMNPDVADRYHKRTWMRVEALAPWIASIIVGKPAASRVLVCNPYGHQFFRDLEE